MESIQNAPYVTVDLLTSLKACANKKDLDRGSKLHTDIIKRGLLVSSVCLGNTLVSMYAKCEALEKAHQVFEELPIQSAVSWNVLISAYARQGHGDEAMICFEEMQLEGFLPDAFTFACVLKACGSTGALQKGQEIHAYILKECMLENDAVISTALVDMYIKCNAFQKALEVFHELGCRNAVSWNAVIAGFLQQGLAEEALNCLDTMQLEGISPDAVTLACALKACASIGDIEKGEELRAKVLREHALEHSIVGNALIDMYAKCGALSKAQEVFDMLPFRDIVSWNALITGYAEHGHEQEALNLYEQLQLKGFMPDVATFVCILGVCASIGRPDIGEGIHNRLVQGHLLEKHIVVTNTLIDMYAKCGLLEKARAVFDDVLSRDLVLWNTVIGGYAQCGMGEKALTCMKMMESEGFSPDAVTFVSILKACGSIMALEKGQETHAQIEHEIQLGRNVVVSNALLDMYLKCGAIESAEEVFENLQVRNVITWNILLGAYAEHGFGEKALKSFERLKYEGFSPNSMTFACTLKGCGRLRVASPGQRLHAESVRFGFFETDAAVGTALVVMYANCGMLADAQDVFNKLLIRDVVSWNAIIGGYAQQEYGEEALKQYKQMKLEGFTSNAVTYASVLKACALVGAVCEGQKVHAEVVEHGLLEQSINVSTTLLIMYGNCCMLSEAQDVFDELPNRDVISWGAVMEAYSLLGEVNFVLCLYDEMTSKGVNPNWINFLIILSACSHRGLVDEGQVYFESMGEGTGISPNLEQYTCIIDMLGRAGRLETALAVIEKMPFYANSRVWNTLLGACLKWQDLPLGKWVFQHTACSGEYAASYVCLSNIFGDAGSQEDSY